MLQIALYQPDIAGNTGTILRTAACLGFQVHVIEPAGFVLTDKALRRAGMDYLELAALRRHADWDAFEVWRRQTRKRLVLLTTKATVRYSDFAWQTDDIALFGRESAGVPDAIHAMADARIAIPMQDGARSLNLAVSVGIVAAHVVTHS